MSLPFGLLAFVFFFGACIGSYLNVLILRLPEKRSTTIERSHCPHCKKLIYWYENIPLVSFLFLRGKCSGCETKISFMYPLVELICGVVAVVLLPNALNLNSMSEYLFHFSIFSVFLVIIAIDFKHYIIPNSLNLYLALVFLVHSVFYRPWTHWLMGGLVGSLFPLSVTYGFYLLRGKVGLGGGDIKLYGALGIFLGIQGVFLNLFLSCFLGALFTLFMMSLGKMDRNTPLAFGPYIVVVAFFQIFLPDQFNMVSRFIFPM